MDLQLKGKKAIVTGGSAGIGLAVARLLAEEGVEVTIPGRHGKKLSEAIASLPGSVHGIEADLGTAEGAKKLIEEVRRQTSSSTTWAFTNRRSSLTLATKIGCDISRSISSEAFGWRDTIFLPCSNGTGGASFSSRAKQPQKCIPI
jgi:NAD(P)-dependent dehydrogenase (short-subunit alcohol dehydrogenase family)